jgi:hypothetical protein
MKDKNNIKMKYNKLLVSIILLFILSINYSFGSCLLCDDKGNIDENLFNELSEYSQSNVGILSLETIESSSFDNIKSIEFFNKGEWSFSYPTIAFIFNDNSIRLLEYSYGSCKISNSLTSSVKYNNIKTLINSTYSSHAYIPVMKSSNNAIRYPFSTQTVIAKRTDTTNSFDIIMSGPLMCSPDGTWKTSFDSTSLFSKTQCINNIGSSRLINDRCCGDPVSGFENYKGSTANACLKGMPINESSTIFLRDRWSNLDTSNRGNEFRELIIKNGEIYPCAMSTNQVNDCLSGTNCNSNFINSDINKPYLGYSNFLLMNSENNCNLWDFTDLTCSKDSNNAKKLIFSNTNSDSFANYKFSQKLFHIKPSTKYHFSVDIKGSQNLIGTNFNITYKTTDTSCNPNTFSKEYIFGEAEEKYNLIFTTPSTSACYDFEQVNHEIIINFKTDFNSIPISVDINEPKLSTNRYLLTLLDNVLGGNFLFLDTTNNKKYCEVIEVSTGPTYENGAYFCGYNEYWNLISQERSSRALSTDTDGGLHFKTIAWAVEARSGSLHTLVPKSVQVAGCCFKDECWNGKECVLPLADYDAGRPILYPNSSVVNINGSNYGCVKDNTGFADWKMLHAGWRWDNKDYGYCINYTQCVVDPKGNRSFDNLPQNFSLSMFNNPPTSASTQNPYCIDSGQFIEDNYCDNGNWTTRTRLIIDSFFRYIGSGENDDYSIICGDYNLILNTGDYDLSLWNNNPNVKPGCSLGTEYNSIKYFNNDFTNINCVIDDCQYRYTVGTLIDSKMPCVNNVCVLNIIKKNNVLVNDTIIAFSHNRINNHLGGNHLPLANLFGVFNEPSFCNNPSNFYCGTTPYDYKVFYDKDKQIVFFSKINFNNPFSLSEKNKINILFNKFLNSFWNLHTTGDTHSSVTTPPLELNYSNDISDFYYAQAYNNSVKRSVYSFLSKSYNRSTNHNYVTNIIYDDFYIDISNFTNKDYCISFKNYTGDFQNYYCEERTIPPLEKKVILQREGNNPFRDYLISILWKLRVGR